ncbi:ATP-dependent helicase, putative [Shewanella piezotolerans WP3]|uniref:ATP-dependent helicase, putative n=1 Tax=Shewanella piezotolerans (strain WP3 / JCM 13877) TaxID=225849 RepID=B8CH66_SHEPW|nr:helicase-related protein [Shewanella piezotolerans]ACJ26858.1 ATP-dependent helicase, putative [Shewanella piezotolerans WP3]
MPSYTISEATDKLTLPIDALYQEFKSSIKDNHLVVESDTGSGKSTRLPLWCTEADDCASKKKVLVVEPRRVACLALADFVGKTAKQGTDYHHLNVGYAIRFDSTVDENTDIAFVTPGIALRWLSMAQDGKDEKAGLACFDTVVIDEFHERRWDTDLLLALLKQRAQHRLVLTSATIDGARLNDYLSDSIGVNSKRLLAKGNMFHVELTYQSTDSQQLPDISGIEQKVKRAVGSLLGKTSGDILVFLPGKREIQQCLQACQSLSPLLSASLNSQAAEVDLVALHGGISATEQQALLASANKQRVIFATNIAETSLTIPGVTAVVDSGLERRTHQRNGRTVLSLARISRASSEQRKGRAGRTQAGLCVRLWGEHAPLESMTPPELQREELVEPMLAAACSGERLAELTFVDAISNKSLVIAHERLLAMGAIDQQGNVTTHGRKLFPLPIDTQFAHLISAMPDIECTELMVDLAAAISVPQRLYQQPSAEYDIKSLHDWEPLGCDAFTLVKLLREPAVDFINIEQHAVKEARRLANQIRQGLGLESINKATALDSQSIALRNRWLLAVVKALPELAFIRRIKRVQALGNGFSEVQIGRDSRFCPELKDFAGKEAAIAAVVFDQHSLAGKGVKQTLNLASVMAPISTKLLYQAGLGEDRLAENKEQAATHKVLIERVYAGRVIDSRFERASGEQAIDAISRSIIQGRELVGVAKRLAADIAAWNIWFALGKTAEFASDINQPLVLDTYLKDKLIQLGVESFEDLALLEPDDILFEGIPDWQREEFDSLYPAGLQLPELKLTVSYEPKRKLVILDYVNGGRKQGPKRWELPRWVGWKIQYRKASRVVDVK